jgi:hypothetical protein
VAGDEVSVEVLREYRYDPVCMKTGRPHEKWVKQIFTYVPPWVYILIVGGVLPLLIVYLIVRKQAIIYLPVVKSASKKRTLMMTGTATFLVFGFVVTTYGISDPRALPYGLALLALGFFMGFKGMSTVWVRSRLSQDATTVRLIGLHPDFLSRVQAAQALQPEPVPVPQTTGLPPDVPPENIL